MRKLIALIICLICITLVGCKQIDTENPPTNVIGVVAE